MPTIDIQGLSKLYYSIGELADLLEVNASLLRFWEKEFQLEVSKKNKKGNRLYTVKEIEKINRIYQFVKVEGYTLDGAKKALKYKHKESVIGSTVPEHIPTSSHSTTENEVWRNALIARLEGVKKELLNLPRAAESPVTVFEKTEEIPVVPNFTAKPTVTKAPAKSKPAPTDMPTLFDF
jgi:DNA-binding transcriptional MerR regulator